MNHIIDKTGTRSEIVTATEMAKLLKVSRSTIYRLAAKGLIPCIRLGRATRFDVGSVMEVISGHTAEKK